MSAATGQGVGSGASGRFGPRRLAPTYAALDLGTNNCRLLIASPTGGGFRILEAFSRIVRLGEGLSRTGRLDPGAQARTLAALKICADKIARRGVLRVRAVATQACRQAQDGEAFIAEAAERTGLRFEIISPREEARLSVMGCLNLLDHDAAAALVMDVGGGSTELSWVDLRDGALRRHVGPCAPQRLPIRAWLSIPVGVVTLAERFPEPAPASAAWFAEMVAHVRGHIARFRHAEHLRPIFAARRAHMIGSSGAITSLAGLHLGLNRYERARVDGLWMSRQECGAAADRLMGLDLAARAASPCIGADRADLVLAGAAILQAVQDLWPCERVRVADRGLREGILLSMMAEDRAGRRGAPARAPVAAAPTP
jgi:exopolyphosphatase/guanosine-5'-triphosphate,3'-diphosphate pyrophosphatase